MTDTQADDPPSTKKPSFDREIDLFISHVESIANALSAMVYSLSIVTDKAMKGLASFEQKNCKVTEDSGQRTVLIPSLQVLP